MVYETIVGRTKEDLEKFDAKAIGYLGKHIVGTGEDTHLTTKVFIDLLRPHVILIDGKRGSGKSYSAAVILEEILSLEPEYLNKISAVVFDPVGIYWSMKLPNEQQSELLKKWNLNPKGFPQVKVYVPAELKKSYEEAGVPVDYSIKISTREFTASDWILAFNLERTSEFAVVLEKNFNSMSGNFSIKDLISKIKNDIHASQHVKDVLSSFLDVANSWGIFAKEGMKIEDIVKPGQISVIDLSRTKGEEWGVRNLLAAWITRQVYKSRVLARKEEELARVEEREPKKRFPLTWLIFEEAHNFIPGDRRTVSTGAILTVAKQGREPGISLVVITQMPNKIHQDVLSQTDLVISFRLTSKADLEALHTVTQTYMPEELWKYINRLPRGWIGSCVIIDDNLEKLFSVQVRPRISHHAGGTAVLF